MTGQIATPCINVCVIEPQSRLCTGCLRSLDEIAGWASYSPGQRAAIMADLPGRKPPLARHRAQDAD